MKSFGELKGDSYNFDYVEKYFRNKDNADAFQVLSDRTCSDLDFQELFMFIDRTNSKAGQQYLYNKLRTIPQSPNLDKQEALISGFTEDPDLRISVQMQLDKLKGNDAYYITSLFQDEHLKPPKWYFIIPILALTSLACLILLPFYSQVFLLFVGVFIINTGIHYWNKRNLFQYLGAIPQLLILNNVARELNKNHLLKELNPTLSKSIEIIDKVRNRMAFFKLEAKLEGDLGMIFWAVLELYKTIFILEPLLLFGVLKKLDASKKEIEKVFEFVGEIDAMISITSLRHGLAQSCIPTIHKKKVIEACDVYHPLIHSCVKNDITVDGKSILLTGSNMSGKTSFIRTIGLNTITALTLNTCFAKSFSLPKVRVYSAIRISDDLLNDKSYYFEEVLTIKEMVSKGQGGESNLFLLDEIYKGTNTIERISAGKAVLSSMAKDNNIVFVSTHDIELADLLKHEYELYHFSEIVENSTVDFDYKLKEGKLKKRNAIRILQINNYPDKVVAEAIELSKVLDSSYKGFTADSM